MENKFYTPELEEFHSGFEFEFFYKNTWHKHSLDGKPIVHHELDEFKDDLMKIAHAITRVKHLDREDIESFGWKPLNNNFDFFELGDFRLTVEDNLQILINHKDGVYDHSDNGFHGTIKNKSELRKLMKQLNIK